MKGTKLLYLGAGYLAGLFLAFKYTKHQTPEGFAREVAKMHTDLWSEAEKKMLSLENREAIGHIFDNLEKSYRSFESDAQTLLVRLRQDGEKSAEDIQEKIKQFTANREELIDDYVTAGKKFLQGNELFSQDTFEYLEKKIDTFADSLKLQLQKYRDSLLKK